MTPIREENTSIKSKRKEHRGLHIVDKYKLCIPNESSHAVLARQVNNLQTNMCLMLNCFTTLEHILYKSVQKQP